MLDNNEVAVARFLARGFALTREKGGDTYAWCRPGADRTLSTDGAVYARFANRLILHGFAEKTQFMCPKTQKHVECLEATRTCVETYNKT